MGAAAAAESPVDANNVAMNSIDDAPIGVSEDAGGAESLLGASNDENLLGEGELSFTDLNTTISEFEENKSYILSNNYKFVNDIDFNFAKGIVINQTNLTIDGNGITIDANNLARIFTITGTNVTLKNFNFINGNMAGTNYGGAIYCTGNNLTIEGTTFSHNNVEKYGSAIYYTGEDLTLNDVIFDENQGGAAISIDVYGAEDIFAYVKGLNSYFNTIYTTGTGTLKYNDVHYWDEKTNKTVIRSGSMNIISGQTTPLPDVEVTLSILDKNGIEILFFTNTTDNKGTAHFDFSDYYSSGELTLGHTFTGNKYYYPTDEDTFKYGGGGEFQELYTYIIKEVKKGNKNIVLNKNVTYTIGKDAMTNGIPIEWNGITIDGKGHTIDAQGMARIFRITGNNTTIKNITFINGNGDNGGSGGAMQVTYTDVYGLHEHATYIYNCTFINNTANYAGTIHLMDDKPTVSFPFIVSNCTFINSSSKSNGAVFYSAAMAEMNFTNCKFINNTGGGSATLYIRSMSKSLKSNVINSTFINNTNKNYGALLNNNVELFVYNCTFENNTGSRGGAIYPSYLNEIRNCTFINNHANNGGAIYGVSSPAKLYDCTFIGNHATNGGAVNRVFNINNCTFISNYATDGGAVYSTSAAGSCANSTFIENHAEIGGAVYSNVAGTSFSGCEFIKNYATGQGGAISLGGGQFTCSNSNFTENQAGTLGGALYLNYANTGRPLRLTNVNFTGNTASMGSAVYRTNVNTDIYFVNVNFTKNRAGSEITFVVDDDKITGTLLGNDGYYDAFYSAGNRKILVTNVTYWNGTEYITVSPSKQTSVSITSNKKTPLKDEIIHVKNSKGEVDTTDVTNENGEFNYIAGSVDEIKYTFLFDGNDNYLPNDGSISAVGYGGEFYRLQQYLNKKVSELGDDNRIIYLDKNYTYTLELDTITYGVNISEDNVIIDGQGYTIDAQGMARIFRVLGENVILRNINFVNASSTHGAAVYWTGLGGNISNCNFTNNTITGSGNNGGSIFADAQGLIIEHSTFKNNTGCTPGILVNKANVKINDCEFTNNTITGGANYYLNSIVSYSSSGTYGLVNNSRFYDNTGRGIYAPADATGLGIRNSNFTNNSLPSNIKHSGGAVTVSGTDLIIDNCNFTNNTVLASGWNGGALFINGAGAHVLNSNFKDNTASNNGGAYYVGAANHVLENCIFNNNYGLNNGNDSVYVSGNNFQLKNNIISNLILDFGTITTTHIVVLDNGTVKGSIFEPVNVTAVITDDNNNVIYVDDLQFISENCTQIGSVIFDKETGIYSAGLLFNTTGTYNVGVSSNKLSNVTVKSGTVIIDPNTVVITILDNTTVKGSIFVPVNITAVVSDKNGEPISLPGFMFVLPDGTNVEPDSFNSTTGTYTLSYLFDTLGEYTISANTTLLDHCKINNCIVNINSDKATICILDNGTAYANIRDSFVINATMVDEYGNSVENYAGLKFVLPDGSTVSASYNSGTGLYSGRYLFDTYGYFSIGAMIDGSASLIVLNGTVVNSAPGSIIVDDINYTETANINITLGGRSREKMINFEGTTGTATVKITGDNGYEMTEELDLGSFEKLTYVSPVLDKNGNNITLPSGLSHVLNVAGLNVGNYTVFVHFTGDSKVPPMEFSTSFKVIKLDSLVNASVDNITYGDVAVIKDNLVNPSEIVTVIISNGTYSGEFKGIGEISISDLEAGNYSVIISYPGDNIYNANNITLLLTVDPADADLNIGLDNDTVDIGGEAILNIALTPGLNTTVIVNVNDTDYTVNLVNGKCTLNLTEKGITSKFGVYTINATLTDIQNFKGNTTTNNITLTVNKINTDLIHLKNTKNK